MANKEYTTWETIKMVALMGIIFWTIIIATNLYNRAPKADRIKAAAKRERIYKENLHLLDSVLMSVSFYGIVVNIEEEAVGRYSRVKNRESLVYFTTLTNLDTLAVLPFFDISHPPYWIRMTETLAMNKGDTLIKRLHQNYIIVKFKERRKHHIDTLKLQYIDALYNPYQFKKPPWYP